MTRSIVFGLGFLFLLFLVHTNGNGRVQHRVIAVDVLQVEHVVLLSLHLQRWEAVLVNA